MTNPDKTEKGVQKLSGLFFRLKWLLTTKFIECESNCKCRIQSPTNSLLLI